MSRSPAEQVIVIEGFLPPEAAAYGTRSIRYLPFDVPRGVTRIHIRREMEPCQRDTVALLVFDPRGGAGDIPGFAGFRGYQGAVNLDPECTITGHPDSTSPWYTPGPLPAGRWNLGQWHMQPAPGGLRYRYTITLGFDGPAAPIAEPEIPSWTDSIPGTGPRWYKGSLHNHTVYSYDTHLEGTARTVRDLVAEHQEAGFDFVAVTDHNQARAHGDFARVAAKLPNVLLLAGNELTTLHGHAGIVGGRPGGRFDFRLDPGDGGVRRILAEAREQNALFIVNHPFGRCMDCPWRYREEVWDEADAIEVWNRPWSASNRDAVDAWDELLKAGRRMPAIGGTDYHRDENTFTPTLWVYAQSLSRDAVLCAIREGRTAISESATGPRLFLSDRDGHAVPGDTVRIDGGNASVSLRVEGGNGLAARFVWNTGERFLPVEGDDATVALDVPPDGLSYVRAELSHSGDQVAALTGPIYFNQS